MSKSKKTKISSYLKAVRKGNREAQLETSPGWVSTHKVHKSKKVYDRKENKKIEKNNLSAE